MSSVLPSSTSCSATCRIVRIRSGSDSRSFHGAWSDRYLFASPTVRIASVIAALNRDLPSDSPTAPNACREPSRIAWSASVSSPAAGIAPMFLAANEMLRLTRFPQLATSSSLLRRMNSLQVKSVSWFSGPGDRDVVAQRVHVVAAQEVAHVDDDGPGRGELAALHRQVLAGDHLGRAGSARRASPACRLLAPLPL